MLSRALFYLSIAFLVFIAGALASLADVFPAGYVKNAYRGGTALYEKLNVVRDRYATDLWTHARDERRGVTVHTGAMQSGATLYTTGEAPKAVLIDADGRVLHEWGRPFSRVWDKSAAVRDPVPDDHTHFHKAHLFPNGDLLAIYTGVGDSPYGYGLVKFDRDSNVIWKNLQHFHHDFDLDADGRIYGLTQEYRKKRVAEVDHLKPPVLDEFLVILSPAGETLRQISLLDAINRSDYRRLLWRIPFYTLEDPLHTNGVEVLSREKAAQLARKIPAAAEGQVLLSFRELDGGTIALLDIARERLVWATRGAWMSQHDPDILPNGDILMFDNVGHYGTGGESRVVEVDPATGALVWTYAGDRAHPLGSRIRSDQEREPNGNTLIAESDGGRLVEVTPGGEIVWEFINPVRGGKDHTLIPILASAERIDPAHLTPEFRATLGFQETVAMEARAR